MDPQDQFKDRYQKYISERNQTIHESSFQSPTRKAFGPNKFYVLGIFVGILLILPVTYFYFANQTKQNAPQVASTPPLSITDAQIDAELKSEWGPYYSSIKNNPKYRDGARQSILIEQKAKQLGVNVTSQQVASTESTNGSNATQSSQFTANQLTQAALIKKVVTWRIIDEVSIYADLSSSTFNIDKKNIIDSLSLVQANLEKGMSMKDAYNTARKNPKFIQRIKLFENVYVEKSDPWAAQFIQGIFTAQKGDVTGILESGGGSFMLAKIIDSNNTPYASFQDWAKAQK